MPHTRLDLTLSSDATALIDDGVRASLRDALDVARTRVATGDLGFYGLASTAEAVDEVAAWMPTAPAAGDVVVVGIGGSALSARVFEALRDDASAGPRLHVIDTVDPDVVEHVIRTVDPADALLIGVSKSGTTLETAAVFGVLEQRFREALGADASTRIVIVCGEEQNAFRAHATKHGYRTLAIPGKVGGRYSALTPVGLLPAAIVGVEPARLMEGAAGIAPALLGDDLSTNPALALASAQLGAERAGRRVHIVWTYGERLRWLGPWWVQLTGESLGKRTAAGEHVGVTAVPASGPADQHSLLQTVLDGPDDKLVIFVSGVGPRGPEVPASASALTYATGNSLGRILDVEREATAGALAQVGRPYVDLRLPDTHASSVGAFMLTAEMATALVGFALGIDPFDQPAVGLGKDLARARLEAPGLEAPGLEAPGQGALRSR